MIGADHWRTSSEDEVLVYHVVDDKTIKAIAVDHVSEQNNRRCSDSN
jgi:hypothetical protein